MFLLKVSGLHYLSETCFTPLSMFRFALISLLFVFVFYTGCRENSRALEHDASEATIASETGVKDPADTIPSDALAVTKALINGVMYEAPSFDANTITEFDTSQKLFVLDTTDIIFVRARILKDSTAYTGYISKAILPEK